MGAINLHTFEQWPQILDLLCAVLVTQKRFRQHHQTVQTFFYSCNSMVMKQSPRKVRTKTRVVLELAKGGGSY